MAGDASNSADLFGLTPASARALQRARAGDVEAFGIVCLELENALWRQSMMFCADQGFAEDMVQETLIIAWRKLDSFDGSSRFITWVIGILFNLHRNMARKKRLVMEGDLKGTGDNAIEAPGSLTLDLVDSARGPADTLLALERHRLLKKCLERLSDEQQTVVQLRFFAGADLREIAAILGCPEGTVKSRLFHAIRKLAGMEELRETFFGTNLKTFL